MYCKELFQSLPKAFYKPIKTHILNTCNRNELIVRKMEGIYKITRDGFFPKCLIVKMKLTCNEQMKNDPETCQRQKAWEDTKKKFQKDMKEILVEQVREDIMKQIQTHIELVLDDFVLFATQYTLYTRTRKKDVYQECKEQDERYAIGAVLRLLIQCKTPRTFSTPSASKPDRSDLQ